MCAVPASRTVTVGAAWPDALRRLRGLLVRFVPESPLGRPGRRFRAVIFKVDRIGDFVLALGALRVALREWGEEHCLLVISPLVAELVATEFPRTPRLVLAPFVGLKRFFPAVRHARRALGDIECEVALSLRHQRWDFDELCLSWLHAQRVQVLEDVEQAAMFAARRAYVMPRATRTIFRDEAAAPAHHPDSCRELRMHRQLLSEVLGRPVAMEEVWPELFAEASSPATEVVICPLGSHPLRDLSPAHLGAVLAVLRRAGLAAVFTGDAGQRDRLNELVAGLRAQGFQQLRVQTDYTLTDFVCALAAAPLVVTTESAAAHLATALDRPAVVILGGGHYGQFGPWRRSERQVWLTNRLECFGCNWRCIQPEAYCITGVPTEALTQAVARVLRRREVE